MSSIINGTHDYGNTEARLLKPSFEGPATRRRAQLRLSAIATEGNEMQLLGLVEALQSLRHAPSLAGVEDIVMVQFGKIPALAKLGLIG